MQNEDKKEKIKKQERMSYMKNIKLNSETPFIQEHNFITKDFFGTETVAFTYTEKEFVEKSLFFSAYDTDFELLPVDGGKTDEISNERYDCNGEKYGSKTFYCPKDFYIACDKGDFGYKTSLHIFSCNIETTDTEQIVTITAVQDSSIIEQVTTAFYNVNASVAIFLNEVMTVNLDKYNIPVDKLISHIENTTFLDIDNNAGYRRVSVSPQRKDVYLLSDSHYNPISSQDNRKIDEGDYIYKRHANGAIEILQVEHFAHSVYAKFFAVAKTAYVYPRDKAAIQELFPDFYMEHCMPPYELEKTKLMKQAVSIPYLPEENQLGDSILYQKLSFVGANILIKDNILQITTGDNGFVGGLGVGTYNNADNLLRVNERSRNASLIQVGDKFKVLFYNMEGIVVYKGEYYGKFKYIDETDFFTEFEKHPQITNKGVPLPTPLSPPSIPNHRTIPRIQDEVAVNGMKYLLYREKIKPIQISKERYEEFKRVIN